MKSIEQINFEEEARCAGFTDRQITFLWDWLAKYI